MPRGPNSKLYYTLTPITQHKYKLRLNVCVRLTVMASSWTKSPRFMHEAFVLSA